MIQSGELEDQRSWLEEYTAGELDIFEDMINKMISSKNASIYKEAKIKKELKNSSPSKSFSSSSSVEASMREASEHVIDEESSLMESTHYGGVKRRRNKLKPSGIICDIEVDPAASSEEDFGLQ